MANVSEGTQRVDPATQIRCRELNGFIYRIWPGAIVGIGLAVTAVWVCILGYSFVMLVELLI